MIDDDFRVIYQDLPTTIGAFVREHDNFHTIILNSRMAYCQNVKSYDEEMWHIENDDLNRKETVDQIELRSHRRTK